MSKRRTHGYLNSPQPHFDLKGRGFSRAARAKKERAFRPWGTHSLSG